MRFVDLEEEEDGREDVSTSTGSNELSLQWNEDRPNLNRLHQLSIVLSCYPIVSQLVRYVDITTLHELSRTCRQIRFNLLQHKHPLMKLTLRCANETATPARRLGEALSASLEQWTTFGRSGLQLGRISSGKVGTCARDMVGECRRCARVVCRNCVIKAPSIRDLKSRHRRLCRTCMKSSLEHHTVVSQSVHDHGDAESTRYARMPCTCEEIAAWLCQDCGQGLRSTDTTYLRGWAWRTRYGACGGVGAGLGQGNEGVECGRYGDCLDAREVEKEIECDADELAEMECAGTVGGRRAGSSYRTHEIVGIGGKVKKKVKKEMLVGAIVKEYEGERMTGKFLRREQDGSNRSWCSWCSRVVIGTKDSRGGSEEAFDTPTSSAPQTPSAHNDTAKVDLWRK